MANVQLFHGDCLELMKNIQDGSVDLVLCDLPYGTTRNQWDIRIPFEPLWEQYHRVCKRNAAIVLFSQMPFTAELVMSNRREFRYEWIYEKNRSSGFLNANRMPMKAHENICVFYAVLPTYNPQLKRGSHHNRRSGYSSSNYGKFNRTKHSISYYHHPTDVIFFEGHQLRERTHPTQKPTNLLEYLIRTYTNAGETVLDNCMGSGSCGVAAVNTARDFIGIELDAGYYEIACKRIEAAQAQQRIEGWND